MANNKNKKIKHNGQQQKEMDHDEPHRNPSSGQNEELMHWWLLAHSSYDKGDGDCKCFH